MAALREYIKPQTIVDALAYLRDHEDAHIIAGGTDILLQIQKGKIHDCIFVDISDISTLKGITFSQTGLWIGAGTKLSDIVSNTQFTGAYGVIAHAASLIGSPQIRNMATIGGNLCNASPSADLSAPLLVLNAHVEIISFYGKRIVPLSEFFLGPSITVLQPGEMLSAIQVPMPEHNAVSAYYKHSTRRAMDLAVVGVSILLWQENDQHCARIGLSAVAPTPIRVYQAEQIISRVENIDDKVIIDIAEVCAEACRPISDVRASEGYRKAMVQGLTKKALYDVCTQIGLN